MKMTKLILLAVSFACIAAFAQLKDSGPMDGSTEKPAVAGLTEQDQAALDLGHKVLAVQNAIKHPHAAGSLEAVRALGLDTRYATMVRGWLHEVLRGDYSIRDASKEKTPQTIKDEIAFLEKAIRAIDLE
jgi:hypothetical protein